MSRSPNPWYVGAVAGMASYIDAAAIFANGIALVIYQQAIGITDTEFGILSGVLTFCIAIGAFFGGRLGDRFGRRRVFLVTMAAIVIGSLLNVIAPGFAVLLPGIILVGLGTGADLPVSLATIAESANDRNRGAIVGLSNMLWGIGIIVTVIIAAAGGGLGHLGGQLLYGHVGVVALIILILRFSIPESQHWLDARSSGTAATATVRLRELATGVYAKPFLALLAFYTLTNLAANTGGQFGTKIAVDVVGLDVPTASLLNLVMVPLAIGGGIWFMRIVDGRRRMGYFAFGAALLVASWLAPAVLGFSTPVFIISNGLNILAGCFAFEGIMKVWAQESFPTLLRASAQGTILAVARLAAGTLAFVTPGLLTGLGARGLYALLAVIVAVGLAAAWWGFHGRTRNEFADEAPRHQLAV